MRRLAVLALAAVLVSGCVGRDDAVSGVAASSLTSTTVAVSTTTTTAMSNDTEVTTATSTSVAALAKVEGELSTDVALDRFYSEFLADRGFDAQGVQVLVDGSELPVSVKTGLDVPGEHHRPCLRSIRGPLTAGSSYHQEIVVPAAAID